MTEAMDTHMSIIPFSATVKQVFRFMDLPLEISRMVYPLAVDARAVYTADQLPILSKDGNEYEMRNGPNNLNISRSVRAEAFQAVVQGSIIEIAETEDEIISAYNVPTGLGAEFSNIIVDQVQAYIDAHKLQFDFLADIRRALVRIAKYEELISCWGTALLRRCPRICELFVTLQIYPTGYRPLRLFGYGQVPVSIFAGPVRTITILIVSSEDESLPQWLCERNEHWVRLAEAKGRELKFDGLFSH
jgi:hypothetical protein